MQIQSKVTLFEQRLSSFKTARFGWFVRWANNLATQMQIHAVFSCVWIGALSKTTTTTKKTKPNRKKCVSILVILVWIVPPSFCIDTRIELLYWTRPTWNYSPDGMSETKAAKTYRQKCKHRHILFRFPCAHGVPSKLLHKHAAPVLISALPAAAPAGHETKCRMDEIKETNARRFTGIHVW